MKSYYTFIASLPPLPPAFDAGPSPLTASSLGHRLSMLENDDRYVLKQLSDFFRWDRQPYDRTDAEVLATHKRLSGQIRNPLVQEIVRHRFEVRTLVAAVRAQRAGSPPPEFPELPHVSLIRRYWDQPFFRLNSRFTWLESFVAAMDANQPLQAQRHLFAELWNLWSRLAERYHFTFESIVLYLARWEILQRWASQDTELGQQRFETLVDAILDDNRAAQGVALD